MKRYGCLNLTCLFFAWAWCQASLFLSPGAGRASAAEPASEQVSQESANGLRNITLTNAEGHQVSLASLLDGKALIVIFIGTECPVNNAYMSSLKDLHAEFADQNVMFAAITGRNCRTCEGTSVAICGAQRSTPGCRRCTECGTHSRSVCVE
jgi:cytochrome oxidase Cu insertion factor (SCO1/SenC/PrrC family)